MSVLDIVGGLAKTAGGALEGYGVDQQTKVRNALAQQQAARDAERDKVLNALGRAQTSKMQAPSAPTLITGKGGVRVPDAPGVEVDVPPVPERLTTGVGPDGKPMRVVDAPGVRVPEPAKPNLSFQTVVPGEGQPPVIVGVDPKTGQKVSEVGVAKPTGSMAKLTGDQEKSYLFYKLMKNAEPEITRALGSGRIRPAAVQGFLSAATAADIPLVGKAIGGVASPLANANLNEDEQQMIRAGKDFAAGVLRKESGAAVTNSELMEVMGRYFPGMFGDKPGMTEAKARARLQYMQTMEEEAGPAISFYGSRQKGGGQTGNRSPDQKLWDDAVAKYGEAKVVQDYGPRPPT